jgi:hypothetical protein
MNIWRCPLDLLQTLSLQAKKNHLRYLPMFQQIPSPKKMPIRHFPASMVFVEVTSSVHIVRVTSKLNILSSGM